MSLHEWDFLRDYEKRELQVCMPYARSGDWSGSESGMGRTLPVSAWITTIGYGQEREGERKDMGG